MAMAGLVWMKSNHLRRPASTAAVAVTLRVAGMAETRHQDLHRLITDFRTSVRVNGKTAGWLNNGCERQSAVLFFTTTPLPRFRQRQMDVAGGFV